LFSLLLQLFYLQIAPERHAKTLRELVEPKRDQKRWTTTIHDITRLLQVSKCGLPYQTWRL